MGGEEREEASEGKKREDWKVGRRSRLEERTAQVIGGKETGGD